MNTRAVTAALAAAAIAGMFGCAGKEAGDKPVAAADAPDTASVALDTSAAFTDSRDGKVYRKVRIDRQLWMAENLNYEAEGSRCYAEYHRNPSMCIISRDGDTLYDGDRLFDAKIRANCAKYGRLYYWGTAQEACPAGWHLPTDKEWHTLIEYAGGWSKAGGKLKSASGWYNYGGGTDDYGFSALPGGSGSFLIAGAMGYWWSAAKVPEGLKAPSGPVYVSMAYEDDDVNISSTGSYAMLSVRCVADDEKEKQK
jgi:uncharacterized protein (TIGR02145 family)